MISLLKKTSYGIGFCFLLFPAILAAQTAHIDFTAQEQKISGFGGVNMPSWIDDLTADQTEKAYGTNDGQIGLSIMRIKVPTDPNTWEQELPTAQRAKNMGAIILASPWSPPAYMKSNNSEIGGELMADYYGDFAEHLSDFCRFMSSNGVDLHAISIQNEPDIEVDYESCDWTPTQMATFLKNNASVIPTQLMASESYCFDRTQTDPILNDREAEAQVDIIGGHIYGGGLHSYPLAKRKGKEVWMSEHLVLDTTWSSVLATGKEIHDCMLSGFNAYLWWYIRRYYSLIDDDGNVTKRGYVMSHFSRFIRPGFYRVETGASPATGVSVSAYRDIHTAVIVAINQSFADREITFSLSGGTVASFDRYETTDTTDASFRGTFEAGESLTITLPARSITTLNGSIEPNPTYTNPVLPGDHPDLTLLKHGDDFYASGSSFHNTPYGTILHSMDLVHWEVISRVIPSDWSELISDAPSNGIWQGAITYFYNSFWFYFSNTASGGQYFCKASSPDGPWSAPIKMNVTSTTGPSGYDNSIFVDDDGTPYMLIKAGQYTNRIQQIGADGHLTGEVINMDWVNDEGQYSWAEGPVMCKRGGWYYYFIAGNVFGGQWVLRSRTLTADEGSWEDAGAFFESIADPDTGFRGPNHITAPVQLSNGTWWVLSHSYENGNHGDWSGLGRQGLLHRITWDENGKPTGTAPTTASVAGPVLLNGGIPLLTTLTDDFDDSELNLKWKFLNASSTTKFSLTQLPGWVRLTPDTGNCHLLQKEGEYSYTLITKLDLDATSADQQGGIYLTNGNESLTAKLCSGYGDGKKIAFTYNNLNYQINNDAGNTVWLKLQRDDHILKGYYSPDGTSWTQVGNGINVAYLDGAQPNFNSWIGNSHGLYAQGKAVDFDFFYYNMDDPNKTGIWLEAECGRTGSLWEVSADNTASNGGYVTIQPGSNHTDGSTHNTTGIITYIFDVTEGDEYQFWARTICPTGNDDSFWVSMDYGEWIQWDGITHSTDWIWVQFAQPFHLDERRHTLRIAYGEDGALLDKLCFARYGGNPSGTGAEASNCSE